MVLHRGGDCKGPFSGGAFQAYDGPILRNRLHALCFVCGSDSDAGIEIVSGQTRVIVGICDKHLPLLESMSAGDSRPPFVTKVRAKVLDQ
jgi:hypothetical protein